MRSCDIVTIKWIALITFAVVDNPKVFVEAFELNSISRGISTYPPSLKPISGKHYKIGMSSQDEEVVVSRPKPRLPLAEEICSTTPGTWAYDTMSRRVDKEILQRTYDDNKETLESDGFQQIRQEFQELRDELQSASTTKLTYLKDLTNDQQDDEERRVEAKEWKELLEPYVENKDTWLSAPWLVTEFYVYRRVMQALGYFDPSSPAYLYDPFYAQKFAGLTSSVGSAEAMLGKIASLPDSSLPPSEGLALAADIALWGNKMDLSIWPADAASADKDIFSKILSTAKENLLHDDTPLLTEHCEKLRTKGGGNIHIIVDNAGFELVTDLALAQYLIQSGIAKTVTFQLKSHPTFVSDAMEKDLLETIDYYAEKVDPQKFPNSQRAGLLWKEFIENKQWICHEHRFWVQPYPMWEMTEPLRSEMAQNCDLAFVKGDANYRRLLGDRLWNHSAPFEDIVGAYFPCPVCALRTLKAELGCGMDENQVKRAQELDENWMVNGRFGVIHYGKGAPE